MQVELTLGLRTPEVYQLFERKIGGDRLFINEVLKKFNKMRAHCHQDRQQGLELIEKTENNLLEMTRYFSTEINRFAQLLKQKEYLANKLEFTAQYHPKIIIYNRLEILLADFLENYDQLIAHLKLLRLSGCFTSDSDFLFHLSNTQYQANNLLSSIIIMSIR